MNTALATSPRRCCSLISGEKLTVATEICRYGRIVPQSFIAISATECRNEIEHAFDTFFESKVDGCLFLRAQSFERLYVLMVSNTCTVAILLGAMLLVAIP